MFSSAQGRQDINGITVIGNYYYRLTESKTAQIGRESNQARGCVGFFGFYAKVSVSVVHKSTTFSNLIAAGDLPPSFTPPLRSLGSD